MLQTVSWRKAIKFIINFDNRIDDDKNEVNDDEDLIIYVNSLLSSGRNEEAIKIIEERLKEKPNDHTGYYIYGSLLAYVGDIHFAHEMCLLGYYINPYFIVNKNLLYKVRIEILKTNFLTKKQKVVSYGIYHKKFSSCTNDKDLIQTLSQYDSDIVANIVKPLVALQEEDENKAPNKRFRILLQKPFHVVADFNFRPGDLILREPPIVLAPFIDPDYPSLFPLCFHCLAPNENVKFNIACPLHPNSCPFVFCSSKCAIHNILVHRQECQLITSVLFPLAKETGFSPGFVLLIIRFIFRVYFERQLRNKERQTIAEFVRYHRNLYDYRHNPGLQNCLKKLCDGLQWVLPVEMRSFLTVDEFYEVVNIIHTNALPIDVCGNTIDLRGKALGIFLHANNFSHSCLPNCSYVFQKGKIEIRAIEPISINEVLSICYLNDEFVPLSSRKTVDASYKILLCACSRCSDVTEGGTFISGIRCKVCTQGILSPMVGSSLGETLKIINFPLESLPIGNGWTCQTCGPLDREDSADCHEIEAFLSKALADAKYLFGSERVLESYKIFESIVDFEERLHSNHYALYNAYVYLTGIMIKKPQLHSPSKFSNYITKLISIARHILPNYHLEKTHIFRSACKLSTFTEEFHWLVISNISVLFGYESKYWGDSIQELRRFAETKNIHTPPLLYKPKLIGADLISAEFQKVGISIVDLEKHTSSDPYFLTYAACMSGDTNYLKKMSIYKSFVRRELEILDLSTGYSGLMTAASQGHLAMVNLMISTFNVNVFTRNEMGLTALLAMAMKHISSDADDENQSKIFLSLLNHVEALESFHQETNNLIHTRALVDAFVNAETEMSRNRAIHYAAIRGKPRLLTELLLQGQSLTAAVNSDGNNVLHLAAISSETRDTIDVGIRFNVPKHVRNNLGYSPLMLAAYHCNGTKFDKLQAAKFDGAPEVSGASALQGGNWCHAFVLGIFDGPRENLVEKIMAGLNFLTSRPITAELALKRLKTTGETVPELFESCVAKFMQAPHDNWLKVLEFIEKLRLLLHSTDH